MPERGIARIIFLAFAGLIFLLIVALIFASRYWQEQEDRRRVTRVDKVVQLEAKTVEDCLRSRGKGLTLAGRRGGPRGYLYNPARHIVVKVDEIHSGSRVQIWSRDDYPLTPDDLKKVARCLS